MNIISSLSQQEFRLLSILADRGQTLFTMQDARAAGVVQEPYLSHLLQRLTHKRILERLSRGLYLLIPIEAGSQRTYSEDALVVGCALARPAAIAYWSALNYHGLTEQIPEVVFVATTAGKFNPTPEVQGVRYRFIRVLPRKFFGVVSMPAGQKQIQITDLEKTVVDALDHPIHTGGLIEGAKALYTAWSELDRDQLLEYADRLDNSAVCKRLGFLLERVGLGSVDYLEQVRRRLRPGLSKLEPLNPNTGPCCTRWNLRLNMDLEDLERWRAS